MSRHEITPKEARYEVTVGWDRPLRTYFAQVRDLEVVGEGGDDLVLWAGTWDRAIPDRSHLQSIIKRYAILSDDMLDTLLKDRVLNSMG